MPDPNQIIRSWLTTQAQQLQQRLDLLQQLLVELPAEPTPDTREAKPPPRPSKVTDAALLALEAAGGQGLTARELASVAHIPIGTASGRLSLMARDGQVVYHSPRYFAVHSEAQDNNTPANSPANSHGA